MHEKPIDQLPPYLPEGLDPSAPNYEAIVAEIQDFMTAFIPYLEREKEFGEDAHIVHLDALKDFYTEEVAAVIASQDTINAKLNAKGFKQLQLTEQAGMKKIADPADILDEHSIEKGNNFAKKFVLKAGSYGQKPVQYRELKDWHAHESHDDFTRIGNHTNKPAFKRMFNLFREYTAGLVLDFNHLAKEHRQILEAELYVAYRIMSKLVDKRDPDVVQNGAVDPNYLTR